MLKIKMKFDNVDNCDDKDLRVNGEVEFEDTGEGFENLSLINDFIDRLQKRADIFEEPVQEIDNSLPVFATEVSPKSIIRDQNISVSDEKKAVQDDLKQLDQEFIMYGDIENPKSTLPFFITSQVYYQQCTDYEKKMIKYDFVTKRWSDEHDVEIIPMYMLSEEIIAYTENTNCAGFLYVRDHKMSTDYMIQVYHEFDEEEADRLG